MSDWFFCFLMFLLKNSLCVWGRRVKKSVCDNVCLGFCCRVKGGERSWVIGLVGIRGGL